MLARTRPIALSFALLAAACGIAVAGGAGESAMGTTLLSQGADTVVSGDEPATLTLDETALAATAADVVTLTLTPTVIADDEAFLVVLDAVAEDGTAETLWSGSFFPPPREGQTRSFIVPREALARAGERELRLGLVPVGEGALEETWVRIEGLSPPE